MAQDDWGLDVQRPDLAANDELGWTVDEDGDWGPAQIRVAAPVTRSLFALHFAAAFWYTAKQVICKTGVHRHGRNKYL